MELLIAALTAYAASQAMKSKAPATEPTTAPTTTPTTEPPKPSIPRGVSGNEALSAMYFIPTVTRTVTDMRAALDPTAKGKAPAPAPAPAPAQTPLEKYARERAVLSTTLHALPSGDARVNPVGTPLTWHPQRLPAAHFEHDDDWLRAKV